MAKTSDSFEDYTKKINDVKLGPLSRNNLAKPKKEPTITEILIEGQKILDEEEKNKPPVEKVPEVVTPPIENSSNPYIRARNELLAKLPPKDQQHLLDMAANKKERTYRYDEFVKEIVKLGDKYSN